MHVSKKLSLGFMIIFMFLLMIAPCSYAVNKLEIIDISKKSGAQIAAYDKMSSDLEMATGTAISPLLVMFGHGLYLNFTHQEGAPLPWHASPYFLTGLGLLLFLIFIKDSAPLPSAIKSPLSALEAAITPIGALAAYISILPVVMDSLTPLSNELVTFVWPYMQGSTAWAQEGVAVSDEQLVSSISAIIAAISGTVIYAVVWLVSNTINILCMIAPGYAGALLKSFRLGILSGLYGLAAIHPLLGLFAALALILFSFIMARWSFKLTVWGGIFAFDLLARRWRKAPESGRVLAFGGSGACKILNIPKRTIGYLYNENGVLSFTYRYLLFFPVTIALPARSQMCIGSCFSFPVLAFLENGGCSRELLTFRLRWHGHERFLSENLGIYRVQPFGLKKQIAGAWSWVKSLGSTKRMGECV